MVLFDGKIKGVALKGVDLSVVRDISSMKMTRFADEAPLGDALSENNGRPEVLLGRPVAERLGIGARQEVNFLVGENRFAKALVIGTFESGLYDYDSQFVLASMEDIRGLFGSPDKTINGVEIKTFDPDTAGALAEVLRGELPASFTVMSWEELNRPIFEAVRLEKLMFAVIVGLLALVGIFNIISSLILEMLYKIKDIAILSAIGMKRWRLRGMFAVQGGMLGGFGTLLGSGLGIALVHLIKRYKLVHIEPEIYFLSTLPVRIEPMLILVIILLGSFVSLLVSYLAAGRVVSLRVAEGLKEV